MELLSLSLIYYDIIFGEMAQLEKLNHSRQSDITTAFFIFPGDFLPHWPEPKRACNRHIPSRPLVRVVPTTRLWDERSQRLPSLLPSVQDTLPEACILQRWHAFYQVCGGQFILNDDAAEEKGTDVMLSGLLLLKILLLGDKMCSFFWCFT